MFFDLFISNINDFSGQVLINENLFNKLIKSRKIRELGDFEEHFRKFVN